MSALLEKLVPEQAGSEAGAFDALRREAMRVLMQHGFPDRKTENWKYTPLSLLEKRVFETAPGKTEWPAPPDLPFAGGLIHIHDGELDPARCRLPDGVTLTGMVSSDVEIEGLDRAGPGDAFAWLNLARFDQGWRIRIDHDLNNPLVLLKTTSAGFTAAVHPRLKLEVGSDVSACLVEIDRVEGAGLVNTVFEIRLSDRARLDHLIDRSGSETALIERTDVAVSAHACYRAFALDGGGRLNRQDLKIHLLEPEANGAIHGVAVLGGRSLVDWHTSIEHGVGPTESAEDFRILADDQSVGVFNGRIRIVPGADFSDSRMNTGNLLLSDTARINTKPELEIDAEEVTASHGATVGQLDDLARFYLRSRGLSDEQALVLLKFGFAAAVFETMPAGDVGDWLAGRLKELM